MSDTQQASRRRSWYPAEALYVTAYLRTFWPRSHYATQVRLGKITPAMHAGDLSDTEKRMLGNHRYWADALVFEPDQLVLIEAALMPRIYKVEQVDVYRRLIPITDELVRYRYKPVRAIIVAPYPHPLVQRMCDEKDIQYVIYRPPFILDYLSRRRKNEQVAPHPGPVPGYTG